MEKIIMVKCIEGFTDFNNDKEKTINAVVEEGKEYKAIFYSPTQ